MAMQIDHQDGFLNIRKIPFNVDSGIGARARIGVIVLATDHTIEYEFRQIVNMPGVAFYESRIPNSPTITPETLQAMEDHISDRAALILPGVPFDVMAYGCTSASMVSGKNGCSNESGRGDRKRYRPPRSLRHLRRFALLDCKKLAY